MSVLHTMSVGIGIPRPTLEGRQSKKHSLPNYKTYHVIRFLILAYVPVTTYVSKVQLFENITDLSKSNILAWAFKASYICINAWNI